MHRAGREGGRREEGGGGDARTHTAGTNGFGPRGRCGPRDPGNAPGRSLFSRSTNAPFLRLPPARDNFRILFLAFSVAAPVELRMGRRRPPWLTFLVGLAAGCWVCWAEPGSRTSPPASSAVSAGNQVRQEGGPPAVGASRAIRIRDGTLVVPAPVPPSLLCAVSFCDGINALCTCACVSVLQDVSLGSLHPGRARVDAPEGTSLRSLIATCDVYLPDATDWEIFYDEETGHPYYFNKVPGPAHTTH